MRAMIVLMFLVSPAFLYGQVVLEADGPGNTYELITSVLAPGADAVESPDCAHPEFGRHIAEVWDEDLHQYVFEFYSHVTPDNDRCINFDRQRVEIKTYEPSPDNLKGVSGETVTYRWKLRIPAGFQPSTSFTHLHQVKPVGGDDGNPLFSLTPRKGSPNRLELIHNNTTKVATAALSLFEGVWVECTEVIAIGASGAYSMVIKKVADGTILLSYSNGNIMTIRPDNDFIRPKWGIYRSLNNPSDLRDEAVRFAGFSIQEGTAGTGDRRGSLPAGTQLGQNYPNPFNPTTTIPFALSEAAYVRLYVYDALGRTVSVLANARESAGDHEVTFDGERLSGGIYFYRLLAQGSSLPSGVTRSRRMVLVK